MVLSTCKMKCSWNEQSVIFRAATNGQPILKAWNVSTYNTAPQVGI